jgi:hypothetical protein
MLKIFGLGVLAGWGAPGLFSDERWQVGMVVGVSGEILVNDIGLPVPVVEGAFGIWPDDSALSRSIFHNTWWRFSCWLWLSAVPVEFGEGYPVSIGGFWISFLEFCDGA